ncbi:unnamed protein product [Camellia sinensis]
MAERDSDRKASYFDEFFKVYLPDQNSQRLRVPPDFVKHFNGTIPNNAILKDLGGKIWHVEMEEAENGIYFKNGWQRFANDHSLVFGDFVLFTYKGNSLFDAKVFGKNGCLKEEAFANKCMNEETSNADKIAVPVKIKEESEEEHTCFEPIHNCKRKYSEIGRKRSKNSLGKSKRLVREASSDGITKRTLHPIVPRAIQGDEEALEVASKFVSKFPFFKIAMKPAYITGGVMNIPSRFLKSYMEKDRESVILLVSDQSWPVKVIRSRKSVCNFSGGWRVFRRENTLKPGDVCIFELVDRNDFVLKVSIFRSLD